MTFARKILVVRLFAAMAIAGAASAHADTILSVGVGAEGQPTPIFIPGEGFTTPDGGPWNNVTFSFVNERTSNPLATGTAYIFSSPFSGTPDQLSSSSFLAASTGNNGLTVYTFSPSFTLLPDTQYFLYADTNVTSVVGQTSFIAEPSFGFLPNPNGDGYASTGPDATFQPIFVPFPYYAFTLTGDVAPAPSGVPEPATFNVMIAGMLAMTARRFRRK